MAGQPPEGAETAEAVTAALVTEGEATDRAHQFDRTRQARAQEVAEDYVELIAELIDSLGEARTVDIARRLGVTHATVNKTVGKLQRAGLVQTRPYRAIFLTEAGRRLAEASAARHRIVVDFLRAIGVSGETARLDAEGIEHYVSEETLRAFEAVTQRLGCVGAAGADQAGGDVKPSGSTAVTGHDSEERDDTEYR